LFTVDINPCYQTRQKIAILSIAACYRLATTYLLYRDFFEHPVTVVVGAGGEGSGGGY
jgi:hypothetical protein